MSVKVKGLDKAIRELSRSGDRAIQTVKDVLADTATDIEQDAKQDAPFELEGVVLNIKQRIDKNVEDNGLVWKVGIQGTQDFDAYVEFGTGQSAREILYGPGYTQEMRDIAKVFYKNGQGRLIGQPFLFPAWIKHTANLVEELKSEVAKAIK
jgi:HK97 gp10 family phage protein